MGSGSNPTASASGGTGVSSMTSASDMVSALPMPSGSVSQRGLAAIAKIGPELVLDYVGVTPQRQNVAGPNRVLQAESNSPVISDGAQQYSVMDLIRYHLLNNTYMLPQDLQNNVTAVNTLLTNQTVDPLGQGIPLLINVYGNSSMNCTVGNGLGEANLTTGGIVASNGVIYVINKVLVPPGPPSQVVSQIPDLAGVNFLLQGNESLASQIDNATNVTIFAPINEALRNMNFQSMDNETFQALIFTHIVEGVYYTTNFTSTNSTGGNSTNTTNNSTASAGSSGPATATEIGMTVVANLLPFPRRQDGPMTGNNGTTGSTNSTGGNNASTVTTLAGSTLTIQPINETSFMGNEMS
ncbi:hypothetical protein DFQ29_007465 [Apophysomyces sp. BC1021]|nr:hypothetical protein DFQ29_007465 [Apophysomyces sp. BC1021]